MSKLEELIRQYCPDGVEYVKIGDVCKIKTPPCKIQTGAYQETGQYPIIDQGQKQIAGYTDDENATLADGEYILYGDHTCIVKYHNGRFAQGADGLKILTANGSISKYVFYAFCAYNLTTTEYKRHWTQAKVIEIPLPPLPVQEEIVRILDTFTELQAELQAELHKRKLQYNYYLDNLLNFNREYEVRWMKLSEVASFTYGYTSKAQDSGNVRYIRITDITDKGRLNPENGKYILLTDDVRPYLLQKGDVIMARTGATYGKTLYYNEDYPSVYASFLIKVTPNQLVDSKYYWHFTRSSIYWEQANRLVGGGAQPQFNTGAISQVKIPVPPIAEQKRIADILDRFDRLTNDLSSGLPAEMEKRRRQYEYYRDKLLSFKRKGA